MTFTFIIGFLIISCSNDDTNNIDDNEGPNNPIIITVTTSDFSITIDENPLSGQVLGTIEGVTNEGTVTFSILNESLNGAFTINSTTGKLAVNNETLFDFEINPTITGTIKVSNGSVFEESNVIINLNDVEESNIYEGNVSLLTQAEVNAFGSNQYTEITGTLRINGWVTSLNSLSSIIKVGSLNLDNCVQLTNLNGLNNLAEIESDLTILNCYLLTGITELSNLNSIGNNINIQGNESLTSLNELSIVNSINGFLIINYNESLTNLNGLNNLATVGDFLRISTNQNLEDITSLTSLTHVNGQVIIQANTDLTTLNGLDNLISIGGFLYIDANFLLTDFCSISTLVNNEIIEDYTVTGNSFNPTQQDIIDGNCSQ